MTVNKICGNRAEYVAGSTIMDFIAEQYPQIQITVVDNIKQRFADGSSENGVFMSPISFTGVGRALVASS